MIVYKWENKFMSWSTDFCCPVALSVGTSWKTLLSCHMFRALDTCRCIYALLVYCSSGDGDGNGAGVVIIILVFSST